MSHAKRSPPGPRRTTQQQQARVIKTLWPPLPGTAKQSREFGESLLCVRYRCDATGLLRYTTVELIVEQALVKSPAIDKKLFRVRIQLRETELRAALKAHGARSDPTTQTWQVRGAVVKKLDLRHRVVTRPHNGQP